MRLILNDTEIDFDEIEGLHTAEWEGKIKGGLDKLIKGSSGRVKNYYRIIQGFGKSIIIGKPSDLRTFRNQIETARIAIPAKDYESEKVKGRLSEVFNYTSFVTSHLPNWGAYAYSAKLNINACVYCNRAFTFTLDKVEAARTFNKTKDKSVKRKILKNIMSSKTRPELDHFYPKEKFPYLALSIYNLVPSCHICNSNLKGSRDIQFDEILHPFEDDFHEIVKINARLRNEAQILANIATGKLNGQVKDHFGYQLFTGKLQSFDLSFEFRDHASVKNAKAMKHIELYALNELYEMHKNEASRMIKSAISQGPGSAKDIYARHNKLFESEAEVKSAIFGTSMTVDRINQSSLSKLAIDIEEDFGV